MLPIGPQVPPSSSINTLCSAIVQYKPRYIYLLVKYSSLVTFFSSNGHIMGHFIVFCCAQRAIFSQFCSILTELAPWLRLYTQLLISQSQYFYSFVMQGGHFCIHKPWTYWAVSINSHRGDFFLEEVPPLGKQAKIARTELNWPSRPGSGYRYKFQMTIIFLLFDRFASGFHQVSQNGLYFAFLL